MARKKQGRRTKSQGTKRMMEQDYKQAQLWFSPNEHAAVLRAAREDRRPLATWIRLKILDLVGYVPTWQRQ